MPLTLKWPRISISAHLVAAIIFAGLWVHFRRIPELTLRHALAAPIYYFGWALPCVLLEVIIGIPPREADLFPNFPLGRLLRSCGVTQQLRNGLLTVAKPVVGGTLHWLSDFLAKASRGWDAKVSGTMTIPSQPDKVPGADGKDPE